MDEHLLDYDMIVIPGGYGGAQNIRDHSLFISLLKQAAENHKYIASICAGPIVLEKAGLLDGKNYTAYVGYDQKIKTGNYKEDIVVVDGSLITSRGPATVYAFAYKLVEILGGDAEAIKNRMAYFNAFNVK